jgi:hypothetical protein
MEYLTAIGFIVATDDDGEDVLRIDNVVSNAMEASMFELNNALDILTPNESTGEEKKVDLDRANSTVSTASAVSTASMSSSNGRMSEKQKARMLMEKKKADEMEEAKRARKKTREQIKQGEFLLWERSSSLSLLIFDFSN